MPKGIYLRKKESFLKMSETRKKLIKEGKIIVWNKGIPRTKEEKKKISENRKGKCLGKNNGFYGKKHSKKTLTFLSVINMGSNHPKWKGGKIKDDKGYILIYSPNHPNKNSHGYVFEHRLIMEKKLGRFLDKKEVVHHINDIHSDNRIENLMLFDSVNSHTKHHFKVNKNGTR